MKIQDAQNLIRIRNWNESHFFSYVKRGTLSVHIHQ